MKKYPEVYAAAQERSLARAFSTREGNDASAGFDAEMARYINDPFRGVIERRILAEDESVLALELAAARDALAQARLNPGDIDLILCASWLPEHFVAPGDAVYLARDLGTRAPAWNIETACSSGLAGLHMAHALIASGQFERILLVVSSTNSRHTPEDNTLGWIISDAAAAAVIEPSEKHGVIAARSVNTAATCDAFVHTLVAAKDGVQGEVHMEVGASGTKGLRETTGPELVQYCCHAVLEEAGLSKDDVRFFGFNTPLAWSSNMCVRALDIDPARTINLHPRFANLGAPFPLINLYYGMEQGRLREDDLAMIFTVGSTSTAGAMVMRWGDVVRGSDA